MRHLTDEELILYHYREPGVEALEVENHLHQCGECRRLYDSLLESFAVLDESFVPEPAPDYPRKVWERIEPRIASRQGGFRARPWALAAAVAVVLVGVFFLGRLWVPAESEHAHELAAVREKLLLVTLTEHLEQIQVLLLELRHAPGAGAVSITSEQDRARQLIQANRLYRQSARQIGETLIAEVLEELERMLMEVANGAERRSPSDYDQFRRQIDSQDLLFKVRVLASQIENRQRPRFPQL